MTTESRSGTRVARSGGFTLIELLVVVAVIAILAAIAVPNMLEAQTRAKVSRVRADLRTVATAIETYTVDRGQPPNDGEPNGPHCGWATALGGLTTPVAYMTAVQADTFQDPDVAHLPCAPGTTWFIDEPSRRRHSFDYGTARWQNLSADQAMASAWLARFGSSTWKIGSCGPDLKFMSSTDFYGLGTRYDPTNGTTSQGDIYRCQALPI